MLSPYGNRACSKCSGQLVQGLLGALVRFLEPKARAPAEEASPKAPGTGRADREAGTGKGRYMRASAHKRVARDESRVRQTAIMNE